ncbi:hypothetical protein L227DRAFT_576334 [Lentinus tigrinus ALCF2SS1-6]|uniref:F-box domain-containing protein n=2 Tax=Lentinus tigrinus TaxID=5365 RepID=A0A5C2SCN5_9APHY|nr:hypothetical protein L227DRAFT_576334 [Lentinus tigrinus ALCF2SS1-6]
MPSLRTLALDRVLLPPSPLWASNLEDLSMRDTIPSLQDMLDLLEQCTSLRTLLVDGYHTWPEDDSRPDHEPVSLPSLKLLDVRTQPLPASEDLLANLILPDAATLRLEVDMMTDDAHPVQLPDMRLCPNIPCIRGLKRIEVLWSNRNCILIRGFRNAQEHVAPDIEVVISAASDFLDLPYDWYLDLSQVEVLVFRLGGMGANSFESWDILQNFPELTTFRLIEPDAPSLFGLLNGLMDTREVQMPDQAGTQRNHRLCPRLHTLELFDFRWTAEIGAAMENMVAVRQTFEPKAFRFLDVYNAKDGPTGHHFVGPHDANVSQVLVVTNAE